jgi:hypothetical protein
VLFCVSDALRRVAGRPDFPRELVPSQRMGHISAAAGMLPDAVDAFGFECRLGEGQTRVDFGTLVTAEGGGREVLAALDRDDAKGGRLLEEDAWARLASFCGDWADPASPVHRHVPLILLEFDLDTAPRGVPVPAIFFSIASARGGAPQVDDSADGWIANRALPTLLGRPVPHEVAESLGHCFSTLPSGGRVLHLAAMYLTSIGSAAPIHDIERLLRRYGINAMGARKDMAEIQFDIGAGISPRIGVEFTSYHPAPEDRKAEWDTLLERLVADGLCAPSKRDALLRWPRTYRARFRPESWPCTFAQEISHVKIVHQPGHPLEAKAYLFVRPRFSLFR